jgi:hypothetical protein
LGKSDIGRWIDAELAIPGRRRVLSMLGLEGREYIECGWNCDRQIHLSQMCSRLRRLYLGFNFPPKSKIRLFEFQMGKSVFHFLINCFIVSASINMNPRRISLIKKFLIICDILPFIVHPSLKVSRSFIDFFVVVMACCSSSVYSSAVVVFLITCYTLCFILILNNA